MKKIIVITILCLILLIGGFLWYTVRSNEADPTPNTQSSNTISNIVSGNLSSQTALDSTVNPSSNSKQNNLQNIDQVSQSLPSFVVSSSTIKDPVNPNTYILVGDLGYCLADGTCPRTNTGDEGSYSMSYDSTADLYTIVIYAKPLTMVRDIAETRLSSFLNLSRSNLCSLNYYVTTVSSVSVADAGSNIGFTACSKLR